MKLRTIIVTGSAGLIGSETVRRFANDGAQVAGIDNDMRAQFFGPEASTRKMRDDLIANVPGYRHHDIDIRDATANLRTIGRRANRRPTSRLMLTAP